MASDRLYEIAFRYKKTKLWKRLWDTEIFAVKLTDGQIAFVSIMGNAGEYCAVGAYLGAEGIGSFRRLAGHHGDYISLFQEREAMASQKCLHLCFDNKQELTDEEVEEVRRYAKAHDIRLAGRNAYPQFVKHEPSKYPWYIQSEQEEDALYQVVAAAIDLSAILKNKEPQDFGIYTMSDDTTEVPMMECVNGTYQFTGMTQLPEIPQTVYARPSQWNEVRIAAVKKQKGTGSWECELVMCPEPIQNNPQETPFFPYLLVMVNSETYFLLATAPVMDYANHPEEIVDHLLENFVKQKWRPEEFLVRDDRTYELLEELAEKLNIPIAIDDDLPALDDVEDDMLNEFGASAQEDYQEIMKMLVSILQLDDAAIQTMPPELIRQLEMMLDDGIVPPELADALTKKLGL